MRNWLREHAGNMWDGPFEGICQVRFTRWKPSAVVTLDDRALTFTGAWPTFDHLKRFKPWNRR